MYTDDTREKKKENIVHSNNDNRTVILHTPYCDNLAIYRNMREGKYCRNKSVYSSLLPAFTENLHFTCIHIILVVRLIHSHVFRGCFFQEISNLSSNNAYLIPICLFFFDNVIAMKQT